MTFLNKVLAAPKKKYKMSKTYETWDEEALSAGATDDLGFEYKNHEFDSLWEMAKEIRDGGPTEPSSGGKPSKSNWYTTKKAEEDDKTGDKTNYSWHPKLSSDEEAAELQKLIKMDRNEFAKAEPQD